MGGVHIIKDARESGGNFSIVVFCVLFWSLLTPSRQVGVVVYIGITCLRVTTEICQCYAVHVGVDDVMTTQSYICINIYPPLFFVSFWFSLKLFMIGHYDWSLKSVTFGHNYGTME